MLYSVLSTAVPITVLCVLSTAIPTTVVFVLSTAIPTTVVFVLSTACTDRFGINKSYNLFSVFCVFTRHMFEVGQRSFETLSRFHLQAKWQICNNREGPDNRVIQGLWWLGELGLGECCGQWSYSLYMQKLRNVMECGSHVYWPT